jgi:hypothetical protein
MQTKLSVDFTESDLEHVVAMLGLKTAVATNFLKLALENVVLFDNKQQDYGPRNMSAFGTFGVVVRMNDEFEMLKTLFGKKRRRRAINEAVLKAFRDISNLALIAYMIETKQWPDSAPSQQAEPNKKETK